MQIHEVIRNRRTAMSMTQEGLAQRLGVSAAAVNKWERALNYPDITLLPTLARTLGVDLNTLLSFQEDLTEKQVEEFVNELAQTARKQGFQVAFQMAQEKLREFPGSDGLACEVAGILDGALILWTEQEEQVGQEKWKEEIQRLYERCAQLIETIPGKNQQNLMVRIEQDCDLYFRGGKAPCVFVDLRLYTPAPAEAKRAFAAALTRELCERFELEPDFVYMNMLELDHWISGGGISFAPGEGGAR